MGSWHSWAAGILPVAVHDGTPFVLLGKDSRCKGGKWSDFAGGGEAVDETPRHTALRELDEETGGCVSMTLDDLQNCMVFQSTTPSGKVLHRYIVRVEYDPHLPARFSGSKDDEKAGIDWFPLGALPPLRHVFWKQMLEDRRRIAVFATTGRAPAS